MIALATGPAYWTLDARSRWFAAHTALAHLRRRRVERRHRIANNDDVIRHRP